MTTLKYPIAASNGTLELTSEPTQLAPEVIKHILATNQEERVLNPEFGVDDQVLSLLPNIPRYLQSLEQALVYGLQEYPNISAQLLGSSVGDSGKIELICLWETDDATGEFIWKYQS